MAKIKLIAAILIVLFFSVFASLDFLSLRKEEIIIPGEYLSETKYLSDYFSRIKGTAADSKVYFFDSGESGGTLLLIGGAHPDEPAGMISPIMLIENIQVTKGRVIILPHSNTMACTHTTPGEAFPGWFSIKTPQGERLFKMGSRYTNPVFQFPDPEVYLNVQGDVLAGADTRNLNRAYPGRLDGNLTEKIAYAIVQLVKKEKVDIEIDLHEASPEYPVVNAIVYHEKGGDIASIAILNLELEDITYSLEPSPLNFRGLSHREIGDSTEALSFLIESANLSQGRLRGRTDVKLVIEGKDRFYGRASDIGLLTISYGEEGIPLKVRCGRHLAGIKALVEAYNDYYPNKEIIIKNFPELLNSGSEIGDFLNSPR